MGDLKMGEIGLDCPSWPISLKLEKRFWTQERGNVTLEGKSERFSVKKTLPAIACFEDGGKRR